MQQGMPAGVKPHCSLYIPGNQNEHMQQGMPADVKPQRSFSMLNSMTPCCTTWIAIYLGEIPSIPWWYLHDVGGSGGTVPDQVGYTVCSLLEVRLPSGSNRTELRPNATRILLGYVQ